jgi:hypothetical protein
MFTVDQRYNPRVYESLRSSSSSTITRRVSFRREVGTLLEQWQTLQKEREHARREQARINLVKHVRTKLDNNNNNNNDEFDRQMNETLAQHSQLLERRQQCEHISSFDKSLVLVMPQVIIDTHTCSDC